MYMKVIFTVINTTKVVLKTKTEKKKKKDLGLYRIWTHDLCDHGVVIYQLSQQASQKLVIVLVLWINLWGDESITVNKWKSYMWTA